MIGLLKLAKKCWRFINDRFSYLCNKSVCTLIAVLELTNFSITGTADSKELE